MLHYPPGRRVPCGLVRAALKLWIPRLHWQRSRVEKNVCQLFEPLLGLIAGDDVGVVAPRACGRLPVSRATAVALAVEVFPLVGSQL